MPNSPKLPVPLNPSISNFNYPQWIQSRMPSQKIWATEAVLLPDLSTSSTLKVTPQRKRVKSPSLQAAAKASATVSHSPSFKQPLQTLHSRHVAGSRQRRTERHIRQAQGTVRAKSPS